MSNKTLVTIVDGGDNTIISSDQGLVEEFDLDAGELNLLNHSVANHFESNIRLTECSHEFEKKWKNLKPSPHLSALEFEHMPILGTGHFGTVRLMKFGEDEDNYCALKVLSKEFVVKQNVVEKTIQEKNMMTCFDFPFLMSLLFSRKDNDFLYIGMPFAAGRDLFTLHRSRLKFDEDQARFYSGQILLAFEYLHKINLVYRDLKLENITIHMNGYLKITDYGLSRFLDNQLATTLCGTPEYLAPEIISVKPYGKSVDWWTFGILIYELVDGYTPFHKYSRNLTHMYEKICAGEYSLPRNFSEDIQDLIKGLLAVRVSDRLGTHDAKHVKDHNFFKTLDWRELMDQNLKAPYRPRASTIQNFKSPPKKKPHRRSQHDLYNKLFENF